MTNWNSPGEIVKDTAAFQKVCLAALGLYTWEVITQLPFDWSIISREREAHWPSLFYFHCKYSLLLALIGTNIANNVTTPVNCQALYTFTQFVGYTSIGSSSTLLMLRAFAVWNRSPYVVFPMVAVSLGQWGLLIHGIVTIRSHWSDAAKTCVVETVATGEMGAIYIYTMGVDLIVLVLTASGLLLSPGRSSLWQLLFRQGVIYFVAAFIGNMLPTVFILLNFNPLINVIFTIPATVASNIVSCRSFVFLTNFRTKNVYIPSAPRHGPSYFRSGGPAGDTMGRIDGGATIAIKGSKSGENCVAGIAFRPAADPLGQTYSMDDFSPDARSVTDPKGRYDFASGDGNGNVLVHIETIVDQRDVGIEVGDAKPRIIDLERSR